MSAAEVLSFEQERAVRAATDWFKTDSNSKPVFKLFGHAGTGKTLLAKIIAERVGGECPSSDDLAQFGALNRGALASSVG